MNLFFFFFFLMYPRSLWRPRVPSEKVKKKKKKKKKYNKIAAYAVLCYNSTEHKFF